MKKYLSLKSIIPLLIILSIIISAFVLHIGALSIKAATVSDYYSAKVSLVNNCIYFKCNPKGEFSFVIADVVNKSSKTSIFPEKTIFPVNENSDDFIFSIKLSDIDDGEYYLNIYTSDSRIGAYQSLTYNNLTVSVEKGEAVITRSPATDTNYTVLSSYQTEGTVVDEALTPYYDENTAEYNRILSLANSIKAGESDPEIVAKRIHDFVAGYLYYDVKEQANITDPYAVLNERITLCEGFSNLTAALMRAAGIPCRVVVGETTPKGSFTDGSATESHAWNEILLNGSWRVCDTTWDSGNIYDGNNMTDGNISHTYFLPGLELLGSTHKYNYSGTTVEAPIEESDKEEELIIYGDINGDSKINIADAMFLYKYVAGSGSELPHPEAADVNHDNKINIADAMKLYKFVAGSISVL